MQNKVTRRPALSAVSVFHYVRLGYRSVLLLVSLLLYILNRTRGNGTMLSAVEKRPAILAVIWALFMLEMVLRFFPSRLESPGCQKQFRRNYVPTGCTTPVLHDNNATIIVAFCWLALNGLLGAVYLSGWIDEDIMLLVCLLYSVCDMICILFFCPFQTWFLKNKCCSSCRIYNWDYAMMFTPLFFVRRFYTWSLLLASVILLLRWELLVWRRPERFSEKTNAYLACSVCTEKLCAHKKQLHTLWQRLRVEEKLREARLQLKSNIHSRKK